jgi:hypothetical protein
MKSEMPKLVELSQPDDVRMVRAIVSDLDELQLAPGRHSANSGTTVEAARLVQNVALFDLAQSTSVELDGVFPGAAGQAEGALAESAACLAHIREVNGFVVLSMVADVRDYSSLNGQDE